MTTLTLYDRVRFVCLNFGSRRDGGFGHHIYTCQFSDRLAAEFHSRGVASVAVIDGAGQRGEIWHQNSATTPGIGGVWWARLLVPEGVAI